MQKNRLLYIPLLVLFAFAISALGVHFYKFYQIQDRPLLGTALPFTYSNGVVTLTPEAEAAGIIVGDRIEAINGRVIDSEDSFFEEIGKLRDNESAPIALAMKRKSADGESTAYETTVPPVKIIRDFNYYSKFIVGFVYVYVLSTFCILLGFWVVFVRPQDPQAWLLLFVLLGLSSLSFEMYPPASLVGAYHDFAFAIWAPAMFLFGIYFPERWTIDRKLPWLKWILIGPLSFQVLITLLSFFKSFLGINLLEHIRPLTNAYGQIAIFINMLAIGMFFATLGHKAGTTKAPDARRRLKLMLYGTMVAMMPSLFIVIYRMVSGARGSFFDVVPFWLALIALIALLLFPLTLAYVIVVYRAMDVGVVIRQGLKYALAKGGVRVLQFLSLIGVALIIRWSINNYGTSFAIQFAIMVAGIAMIPVIDFAAKPLGEWIDRRFFREAYNTDQILSDLSENVRTMVETRPLLETVAATISETLHVPQVAMLLKNGTSFEPAFAIGFDTPPPAALSEKGRAVSTLSRNQHIAVYDEGYRETTSTPMITGDERKQIEELNSQLLLPLAVKGALSGILSLSPKQSEEPYTASDLRLLKSVASQTGLALENSRLAEAFAKEAAQKERLNAEVDIAREVQERLFPQELPPVEGIDYFGACRPALGVGGDYYDFLALPGGKFGIAIGDISGKGIGASLMMASLQASLRGQSIHFKDDLAGLMSQINALVYEASTSNRYATFFYSQYDPKTRKLSYVNGGHNPPYLVRKDGEVIPLETGGPVVGMLPPMIVEYEQGEIDLLPGDLLIGFTDGISEAMNPKEEEWGEDAMLECLKNRHRQTVRRDPAPHRRSRR